MKRKLPVIGEASPHFQKSETVVHSKLIPIVRYPSLETTKTETASASPRPASPRPASDLCLDSDYVAVEEPMEIRLVYGREDQRQSTSLSITMRTPGDDFQLALGFLVSEGIVSRIEDIESIQFCGPETQPDGTSNITKITLTPNVTFSLDLVQRHFYTTSSCGICGKASLDAVELSGLKPMPQTLHLTAAQITSLPDHLREAQLVFQRTGGLHASGIFTPDGQLQCLKEDVGRHNALDKVVGFALETGRLPWSNAILVVSGRASFELVQKAVMAGFEVMIAVGAPSSLAVDLAERFGLTLIGFANRNRFNLYTHANRVSI